MRDETPESLLGAYRVLDLTDEKGLLCGRILGDLGADVIKVEKPGGDKARSIGPFYKDITDVEKSLYWFFTNLNKRSITLDIEQADGQDLLKHLVRTAHFVIESSDPGHMAGLGLGYEDLEKINPHIIMTSITPYGQTGPYMDFQHSDVTTWAMGGMMSLCGDPDRAPVRTYPQTAFLGGLHGALGSMVAHYFRESTGEGQHVDVSIQQACMLTLMNAPEYWDVMNINIPRLGSALPFPRKGLFPLIMPAILPCKDGHVTFFLPVGSSPVMLKSNAGIVGMMDEENAAGELKGFDWASLSLDSIPQEEYDRLREPVEAWLRTKTKAELYEDAVKKSVLLVPVSNAKDLAANPQLRERQFWVDVAHPELDDTIVYPGAPVRISACPWRVWRRPPLIGEHNSEVYEDELGFSRKRLEDFKTQDVV